MIGSGFTARRHAAILRELGVTLSAHVSGKPEHAEKMATEFGGTACPSLEDALADKGEVIDFAVLAVQPFAHAENAKLLAASNTPFLTEKPLGTDVQHAREVGDLVEHNKLISAVCFQWRYIDDAVQKRIFAMLEEYPLESFEGAWRDHMPPPSWWRHKAEGGGQLIEQTIHIMDMLRYFAGEVAAIESAAEFFYTQKMHDDQDVADGSEVHLRLCKDAVRGSIYSYCRLTAGEPKVYLRLNCKGGRQIVITREDVTFMDSSTYVVAYSDPTTALDIDFLKAVRANNPSLPRSPYSDALATQQLAYEAQQLASKNARITTCQSANAK